MRPCAFDRRVLASVADGSRTSAEVAAHLGFKRVQRPSAALSRLERLGLVVATARLGRAKFYDPATDCRSV